MKKKIKRCLAIILTIAMLLTMSVPAFAEEPEDNLKQSPLIEQEGSDDVQKEKDTSLEDSAAEADSSTEKLKKAASAKAVAADETRTVLYADGTLILNELAKNQTANEAKHGAASKEFHAWDVE